MSKYFFALKCVSFIGRLQLFASQFSKTYQEDIISCFIFLFNQNWNEIWSMWQCHIWSDSTIFAETDGTSRRISCVSRLRSILTRRLEPPTPYWNYKCWFLVALSVVKTVVLPLSWIFLHDAAKDFHSRKGYCEIKFSRQLHRVSAITTIFCFLFFQTEQRSLSTAFISGIV